MIGIIGAMDVEVDEIKAMTENSKCTVISGIEYVFGVICGKEVVVAKCNPGKVNAAVCAQIMILKFNPEFIINVGVAGSLSNALDIGDIAVANATVQYDMDTSPLGDPVGFVSGINMVEIACDRDISDKLSLATKNANLPHSEGKIATGDRFVSDDKTKGFIKDNFGCIACEMEGASIGQVCVINNIRYGVLRAISDKADGSSTMDYPEFVKMAAANSVKIIREFLKIA